MRHDGTLEASLRRRLTSFERRTLPQPKAGRHAAVALVVLPDADGDASVIVTQRAAGLRRHGGQWALPGGRLDEGEGVMEAALRELEEEVGVTLDTATICGCLDDFHTRSGYLITPVVMWSPVAQTLTLEPGEVAAAHLLTLSEVGRPEAARVETLAGSDKPLFALAVLETWIFAPTAAILHQFAELAVWGRTTRVAHYEQPRFAWS